MLSKRKVVTIPVVVLVLMGLFTLVGPHPAQAAREPHVPPTMLLFPSYSAPAQKVGEVFDSREVLIKGKNGMTLDPSATANGPVVVDDEITVYSCSVKSQTCDKSHPVFHHQFDDCTTAPQPSLITIDSSHMGTGDNLFLIELSDVCGALEGNGTIYVSSDGLKQGNSGASDACSYTTEPIFESSAGQVSVGGDHRIHGSASIAVQYRLNCSAQVRFKLQTRVCNRFGWNCNNRDIYASKYSNLRSSGSEDSVEMNAACRSGTDKYRVQVDVLWVVVEPEYESGKPFLSLVTHRESTPDGDAGWTELTC